MNTKKKFFDAMQELLDRLRTEPGIPAEARDAGRAWSAADLEFGNWFMSPPTSDAAAGDEALVSLRTAESVVVAAWERYEESPSAASLAEFLSAIRAGIELQLRWASSGL